MILTDYYRFEKLPNQKSKLRIDCTASTISYNPLEGLKNKSGELFLYIGDNSYTKAGEKGKSDLAISKTKHISSVYNPDVNQSFWYGDMRGTADALLFVHSDCKFIEGAIQPGAIIEVFVARGQRNNRTQLYNALVDGDFDEEMAELRAMAAKKNPLY